MIGESESQEKSKESEGKGGKEGQERAAVSLTADQYDGLLDRIAELEAMTAKPSRREVVSDVDELAEEGRREKGARKREEPAKDVDDMTNKELAQFIVDQVNEIGLPLMTEVQTLKVLREIDKCEIKHEDFWDYEKEVREISTKNPTLSIEEAYQLAKSKGDKSAAKKGKEEGSETPTQTHTEKILKLPPKGSFGEKPGPAASTVSDANLKTTRAAALKAWDEVVGKGKKEI